MLMQPLQYLGVRLMVTIAVALLDHGPAGMYGGQPDGAGGGFAAVVAHHQEVGLQRARRCLLPVNDDPFLRCLGISGQQGAALPVADVQHTTHGIGLRRRTCRAAFRRMQHREVHAVPLPGLLCSAGHDRAHLLQGVAGFD